MAYEPISLLHVAHEFLKRIPFPERFLTPEKVLTDLRTCCYAEAVQLGEAGYQGQAFPIPFQDVQRLGGDLEALPSELDRLADSSRHVHLVCVNEGEVERMGDVLAKSQVVATQRLHFSVGTLANGFEFPSPGPVVLTVNQLLRRATLKRTSRRTPSRASIVS